MDRRGRELFEVGHSRTTRLQEHDAILQTSPHDLTPPRRKSSSFLSWRPRRARLLIGALGVGLALGAAEEAMRRGSHAPQLERAARFIEMKRTILSIVSMFSGTVSSSLIWIAYCVSRKLRTSTIPTESIKPRSVSD